MDKQIELALEAAKTARLSAHAPYSKFFVGAAFKFPNDEDFYTGFNIENASYPASMCAERTAIYQSYTRMQKVVAPEYLVVVTDTKYALGPCGQCLQVLTEFCDPEMPIYLANLDGIKKETRLKDLIHFDAKEFTETLTESLNK